MAATSLLSSSILWALLCTFLMIEMSLFVSNSMSPLDRKPLEELIDNNNTTNINNIITTTTGYDKSIENAAKYTACLIACYVMHGLSAIWIAFLILLYDLNLFKKKFPSLLNLILLIFTVACNITGCILLRYLTYWDGPKSTNENPDKISEYWSFANYGLILYSGFGIILTITATTLKTFEILYKRSKRPPPSKEITTPVSTTPTTTANPVNPVALPSQDPAPIAVTAKEGPPTGNYMETAKETEGKAKNKNDKINDKSTKSGKEKDKNPKKEKKSEENISARKRKQKDITSDEKKENSGKEKRSAKKDVKSEKSGKEKKSKKSDKSKSRKSGKEKEKKEEKRKSRKDDEKNHSKSDKSKKKDSKKSKKESGKSRDKSREKDRKRRSRSDKYKRSKKEEKSKSRKEKSRSGSRKKSSS